MTRGTGEIHPSINTRPRLPCLVTTREAECAEGRTPIIRPPGTPDCRPRGPHIGRTPSRSRPPHHPHQAFRARELRELLGMPVDEASVNITRSPLGRLTRQGFLAQPGRGRYQKRA
ncbi:hypothetical protein GCM10010232_07870 [Streptomyces amakusaensis]